MGATCRVRDVLAALVLPGIALALAFAALPATAEGGRTPKPVVAVEKPGQCVADTAFMRRNHMLLLKHDRDKTVHDGIRKIQGSLKGCVECHASSKTGAVNASPDDFCMSCHQYAGVTLDCFECHAGSPGTRSTQIPARPTVATEEARSKP